MLFHINFRNMHLSQILPGRVQPSVFSVGVAATALDLFPGALADHIKEQAVDCSQQTRFKRLSLSNVVRRHPWFAGRKEVLQTAQDVDLGKYPDYYLQNFHFQSDGWLSDNSAQVYEYSTETLFSGTQVKIPTSFDVAVVGKLAVLPSISIFVRARFETSSEQTAGKAS